jgi:hypothetical protein
MAENRTLKGIYGEAGAAYVKDASQAITGNFCAITSLDNATYFSAITWGELNKSQVDGTAISNTDALADSNATIPAGTTIYGQITGFTLGAGRVIAYNAA